MVLAEPVLATIVLVAAAAAGTRSDELDVLRERITAGDDPLGRLAAVEDAVVIATAAPGSAVEIARLVARALLDDDDFRVRAAAARAVRKIDAETALDAVTRAIPDVLRDKKKLFEQDLPLLGDAEEMTLGELVERSREITRLLEESSTQMSAAIDCRLALGEALQGLRDDRAVAGIAKLLRDDDTTADSAEPYVSWLIEYRTQNALAPVVDRFAGAARLLRAREGARRKLERGRPGKKLDERISDAEWEARERARIAAALVEHDALTRTVETYREDLRERLVALGTELGWPAVPEASASPSAWTKWWKSASDALPATVADAQAEGAGAK